MLFDIGVFARHQPVWAVLVILTQVLASLGVMFLFVWMLQD
jgi:hypothetical protein